MQHQQTECKATKRLSWISLDVLKTATLKGYLNGNQQWRGISENDIEKSLPQYYQSDL